MGLGQREEHAVWNRQVGDYQRKTQSPLVWFAMRKSSIPRPETQSFSAEGKQALAKLRLA